jgi:hypothetical protein
VSSSETSHGDPEPFEASEEQAYFRAIEDAFIALRGAPLLLSPADWQAARGWQRQGVPLDLVRRVLVEIFEKRRERGVKGRVNSLRYCDAAVTAAWLELRELQGPGEMPASPGQGIQVGARLGTLVSMLPAELPGRRSWVERLLKLEGEPAEVEEALAALDAELIAAAEEAMTEEEAQKLDQEVETALAKIARRIPASELEAARGQLRRQRLRAQWDLPLLTLFDPSSPDPSP